MEILVAVLKDMGVPAGILFSGAAIWLLWKIQKGIDQTSKNIEVMGMVIGGIKEDIQGLKTGKMWINQCNERHDAIQRTLDNHETRIHELEKE